MFDDPVTGVSLKVGAKRAKGGKLVIFSGIARSPDKGTFQTAFLERPSTGETMAPSDVGPCDLWGEWKLTVSWTKDTHVNGEHVDHQEGGWSETGRFSSPGSLSKVDAPDGLWKRMGFSNASNGAREIGMIFDVAPGNGPLTFVIHVPRPKGDPVMTVPFVLTLTEGPGGKIAFTRAEDPPCPPETRLASTVVSTDAGPPGTGQPAEPPATTTRPPATPSTERPPPTQIFPEGQLHAFDPVRLASGLEEIRKDDLERRKALDAARCEGPEAWRAKRDALLKHLRGSLDTFSMVVGEGRRRNEVDSLVTSERVRLTEAIAEVEALPEPPPTQTCPATPVPEEGGSILDSIEEVFVPA